MHKTEEMQYGRHGVWRGLGRWNRAGRLESRHGKLKARPTEETARG